MVNKDEKTKTYCVICSFDNMFVIAQKLWWLLMCINVYHDVTDVLKFADSPKDIIFWLRHQKYFVGVFSMVHLTSSDSPKLLTPTPSPPCIKHLRVPLEVSGSSCRDILSCTAQLWNYPGICTRWWRTLLVASSKFGLLTIKDDQKTPPFLYPLGNRSGTKKLKRNNH